MYGRIVIVVINPTSQNFARKYGCQSVRYLVCVQINIDIHLFIYLFLNGKQMKSVE